MPCTQRRMSFTATGSLSSPGSIGTPMYRSRSDTSRVSAAGSSNAVMSEALLHQRGQFGIAHLGVASGHWNLAVGEEQHPFRDLVGRHPLPQEGPDVVLAGGRAILQDGAQHD